MTTIWTNPETGETASLPPAVVGEFTVQEDVLYTLLKRAGFRAAGGTVDNSEHVCGDGVLAGTLTATEFVCGHGYRYPIPGGRLRTPNGVIIFGTPEPGPTPTIRTVTGL